MGFEFERQMCVVEFNRNTYDFVVLNAATYAFLKYRFYIRLDGIFLENSREILDRNISEGNFGKAFALTVEDGDGKPVKMACRLAPSQNPDTLRMSMISYDVLRDSCSEYALRRKINSALLSQYDDIFFSYDRADGIVTFWRGGFGEKVLGSVPLEELETELRARVSEDSLDDLATFASGLRLGTRAAFCNLRRVEDDSVFVLSGTAIYEDCVYRKTVGRFGRSRVSVRQFNLYDPLTGVYLKGPITDYARERINERHEKTAIAIVDLDDFKLVNDNFGHAKGDEVLRKVTDVLKKCCYGIGKVGRIGGDEFFVVYDNFEDIRQVRFTLMALRSMTIREFTEEKDGFVTTISVGCSLYPDDYNGTFEEMFKLADEFLYRAKAKGKDRYIVYNEEKHGPAEEIVKHGFKKSGLDRSEYICKLSDMLIRGEHLEVGSILEGISHYFAVERVVLYDKTNRQLKAQFGQKELTPETVERTIDYLYNDGLTREYSNGTMRVNNSEHFAVRAPDVYLRLMEQSTFALQHYEVNAKSGVQYVLSCESVSAHTTWNTGDIHYYRIIVKILERIL